MEKEINSLVLLLSLLVHCSFLSFPFSAFFFSSSELNNNCRECLNVVLVRRGEGGGTGQHSIIMSFDNELGAGS